MATLNGEWYRAARLAVSTCVRSPHSARKITTNAVTMTRAGSGCAIGATLSSCGDLAAMKATPA